jgi:hypothetical protein
MLVMCIEILVEYEDIVEVDEYVSLVYFNVKYIVWNVAGEFVIPKNITRGLNKP